MNAPPVTTEKKTGSSHAGRIWRAMRRTIRLLLSNLSDADRFIIFVGNPRSGTTLVRSLLNAHPGVMIANELNVLKRMAAGESWNTILRRLVDNEREFTADPVWTGYSYAVPPTEQLASSGNVRVIGDKKAGGTSRLLQDDPELLSRFCRWSPLPVCAIHCVRHPLDVIATKTRRNGESLNENVKRYFAAEQAAVAAAEDSTIAGHTRVYLEDLIMRPRRTLQELLSFIGLDAADPYVRACESVVYNKPNLSRFRVNWSAATLVHIEQHMRSTPHLSRYLTDGRLLFDEEHHSQTDTALHPVARPRRAA